MTITSRLAKYNLYSRIISFAGTTGDLLARVLLMLRLPLAALRSVSIRSSRHCMSRKQNDLPNTSLERNARAFLEDVRVLKRGR